jgi:hypothetical protein
VALRFEELDWQNTPMGEISLRRRVEPTLGDEYLMSSLFTAAEVELARLGLADVDGDALDVLVGGLGLGYTAATALEDPRVRSLSVGSKPVPGSAPRRRRGTARSCWTSTTRPATCFVPATRPSTPRPD